MKIILKINNEWVEPYKYKQHLMPAFIHLEHEGACYPEEGWIDNPVTLLGWWLETAKNILNGEESQGISFMEGPFFVDVSEGESGFLKLQCEDEAVSWNVKKKTLLKKLSKLLTLLLSLCTT